MDEMVSLKPKTALEKLDAFGRRWSGLVTVATLAGIALGILGLLRRR